MSASSRDTQESWPMSSTSTTFSILNSEALMRWPAPGAASATIVIRDTARRSEWPTVSEMMLMFKRRKSEATRVSAPGVSSTSATNVCSISHLSTSKRVHVSLPLGCPTFRAALFLLAALRWDAGSSGLWLFRGLDQRVMPVCWAANHLVERGAGADHRVHGVLFFDMEVDQERAVGAARLGHGGQHLRRAGHRGAGNAMRPGQLHKVGRKNLYAGVIALVHELLPLA